MPDGGPNQRFWRDPALPFLEARTVRDGREVCYGKHTHDTFSVGIVTRGRSTYLNRRSRQRVGAGAMVVIDPDDVHACNPVEGEAWSYRMLYADVGWLAGLQHDLGFGRNGDFRPFGTDLSTDPGLYRACDRLHEALFDPAVERDEKHAAAVLFFSGLHRRLNPASAEQEPVNSKVTRAAEFISDNFASPLTIGDICAETDLSPSYLIRAFDKHYGMTPHAFLVNRRVQYGRAQLKRGRPIVDVALEAGFADQAHFQRAFKRLVAATPGQYRA